jgi:hypothetical protein
MPDDPKTVERLEQFSQYVWQASQRGMSRREFVRRGLRLGLSLPAIAGVLVGCGVDPQPLRLATRAPTASAAASAAPAPTATSAPVAATPALPSAMPLPTATDLPTPAPAPLRFAVIGDFGQAGLPAERVAGLVANWGPDFVVTTGDNNYPSGEAATIDANVGQYYRQFIGEGDQNRFFPVLGNHDGDSESGAPYLSYFSLPGNERYYTVEHGPVRIHAVNSVPWIEPDGAHPESAQAAWLQAQLAASPDRWNVVVFHHPPYSSDHRGPAEWMRWPFGEWGADVVLCGHNHVYERVAVDGLTYLINGLGGGARYAWGPIAEGSQVRYNDDHGALLVEATPERIVFQFFAVSSGDPIDRYALPA